MVRAAMIGSKPENSRCEPAQLDKYKNALSTYICIKVAPGIPQCLLGALVFEQPKPSGTFTYMRTLGILFKVKKSNN